MKRTVSIYIEADDLAKLNAEARTRGVSTNVWLVTKLTGKEPTGHQWAAGGGGSAQRAVTLPRLVAFLTRRGGALRARDVLSPLHLRKEQLIELLELSKASERPIVVGTDGRGGRWIVFRDQYNSDLHGMKLPPKLAWAGKDEFAQGVNDWADGKLK